MTKTIPTPKTKPRELEHRAEVAALTAKMSRWKCLLDAAAAELSADLLIAQERHQPTITDLSKQIEHGQAQLETWARSHRKANFNGSQSMELPHGILRFRIGQRALGLARGQTWKTVLQALKGKFAIYRRNKPEIDKVALLAATTGETPKLDAKDLALIGVKIDQDEKFEVELKPFA